MALVTHPQAEDSVVANVVQKNNPIIPHIRSVSIIFANILPDYLVGRYNSLTFISIKFLRIHGILYLRERLKSLGNNYRVRILLCLIDTDGYEDHLSDVTITAIDFKATLFTVWSPEEGARAIESFKALEKKGPEFLLPRLNNLGPLNRAIEILTSIPSITKVDAMALITQFQSLKKVLLATEEELRCCPGLGDKKVKAIKDCVEKAFFGS